LYNNFTYWTSYMQPVGVSEWLSELL